MKNYKIIKDETRLFFQSNVNVFQWILIAVFVFLFFIVYSFFVFRLAYNNIFVPQNSIEIARLSMLFVGWCFLAYWCIAVFLHDKYILDQDCLSQKTTLFRWSWIKHYPIEKIIRFDMVSKSSGEGAISAHVICVGNEFNVNLHSDSYEDVEYICRELNRFLEKVRESQKSPATELNYIEINSLPTGIEKPSESLWDIEKSDNSFSLLRREKYTAWVFWSLCFCGMFSIAFFILLCFALMEEGGGDQKALLLKIFMFIFLFPLGYSIYKISRYAIEELHKKTQVSKWHFFKDKLLYYKKWSELEQNSSEDKPLRNWKSIQLDPDTLSGSKYWSVVLLDIHNNEIAVIRLLSKAESRWIVDTLLSEYGNLT